MRTKLLLAILTITLGVLVFGAVGASAAVIDSGKCGANLTWTLDDKYNLTISGTGDMDYYLRYHVPWNKYMDSIVTVTIPDSVTSISNDAFYNCTGLTSVYITDIAAWCNIDFNGNDSNPLYYAEQLYLNGELVTDLIIPDGVTRIGEYAFCNCTALTSVTIPDCVTSIGSSAFCKCSGLTSVTIPDSVTSIGDYVFYGCNGLTSVTIPDSVTSIGRYAFIGCNGLTSVHITDVAAWCNIDFCDVDSNPLHKGANLYLNEELLTSLIIPDNVTRIGEYAFYNCTGLTSVTIPDSVTSIGSSAFYCCTGLTSVTIPDSVTSIGSSAFYCCTGLTNVTIPDSVTSIGDYAFCDCAGLTSVTIPDSVTSIGDYAFCGCRGLTSVTIGKGLELIPENAFRNCTGLKSVCIPTSVKYIRNDAFNGCANIDTVFYEGDEAQWKEILFYNRNDNLTNAKIVYNAVKRTYKFETNCDTVLQEIKDYAIFTAPSLTKEGATLLGWYDNANFKGKAITFPYAGEATTLYAAWTDKQGTSFDDALILKMKQTYTVTTTQSGQFVYYEFTPSRSKIYKFYSTGSKDTYATLYNSSKSSIRSDDDSGDGSNFSISYSLTAGQTYYLAVKLYSGTGSFNLVTEEPDDYKINSVTAKDLSGNALTALPKGVFLATVSFTNISATEEGVVVLVQYAPNGAYKGLMYVTAKGLNTGATLELSIPVDNTNGDVGKLKAFCWASFESMTPVGNSVEVSF